MYGPRPVLLQATPALLVVSFASVTSPRACARTAKIGRSGARPLATMSRSPAEIGVGAVILELPPTRHSSWPVRGSYARTNFEAFVTSWRPSFVLSTLGVPHDGNSSRSVFQTVFPVFA